MPQYLKIKAIPGNVTARGAEGSIQVHGLTHAAERSFYQSVGTSNKELGIPNLSLLTIHKAVDNASAALWQYFLTGKCIPEVTISRVHLNSGQIEWQQKTTLHNVFVTGIHESTQEQGASEVVEFSFSKMERGYRSQSGSGSWQTPKHTAYNLETAQAG